MDNNLVIGHFGGNSSAGQYKNEDGCMVWVNQEKDWEFAIILDAHKTAQSAELVLETFGKEKGTVYEILQKQTQNAFDCIQAFILNIFKSEEFQESCSKIQGETACLFVIRKENYLCWFSVGDCILHLHHHELSTLGEYQQNHRSFYEWIGEESTFNKSIPCYSSGIKELRTGENHIFLTTDGLVECPGTIYKYPEKIFEAFKGVSNQKGVTKLLEDIQDKHVRDSTTIISWKVINNKNSTMPSVT
ncbi:protein phosphatase 2C domain-containing protein [Chengkuizengella axinellae]|uniref:Protein phosphatase 2C domain-containing protein n=1 Tax=Chengkuizengella axinellae TaxID=3064388 RepID=A0ABT9J5C6_9BACL|nr:protein phosphatase 2C domain-containing protein [Chengkuizengella sp. 2205SS18-9]MDP5276768.1 protein phosphatase 2C domain-containing protein [Chengkuizengella sp. 2205SS18-9]